MRYYFKTKTDYSFGIESPWLQSFKLGEKLEVQGTTYYDSVLLFAISQYEEVLNVVLSAIDVLPKLLLYHNHFEFELKDLQKIILDKNSDQRLINFKKFFHEEVEEAQNYNLVITSIPGWIDDYFRAKNDYDRQAIMFTGSAKITLERLANKVEYMDIEDFGDSSYTTDGERYCDVLKETVKTLLPQTHDSLQPLVKRILNEK